MKTILLLWIISKGSYGYAAMTSVQFDNLESCRQALTVAQNEESFVRGVCVPGYALRPKKN